MSTSRLAALAVVALLATTGLAACDGQDQEMKPFASMPASASATPTSATPKQVRTTPAPAATSAPAATTAPATTATTKAAAATTKAVPATTKAAPATTQAAPATTQAAPPTQAAPVEQPVQPADPAPGAGQYFKNCAALTAVYPHGVARTGGYDNKGRTGFVVNDAVYQANPHLDGDGDGVACER